jgi:hypothetical protein
MLIGIKCPRTKKLADCQKCKSPCLPIPLMMSLLSDRELKPNEYHLTELSNPLRIAYLNRKYNYMVEISDVENVWIGTAIHYYIAQFKHKDYIADPDTAGKVEIDKDVFITLTPDLYDTKRKIIYDFKVVKTYEVEKIKKDGLDQKYLYQLNGYRAFKFPEAKKLILVFILKDYTIRTKYEKDIESPFVEVEVPIIETAKEELINKAKVLHKALTENKPPEKCSPEESWDGKRCDFYCSVNKFCRELNNNGRV